MANQVFKIAFLCSIMLLFFQGNAYSHAVRIFAAAEGETIKGYVYFPGGGRLQNGTIKIYGPGEAFLAQVQTDQNGAFTYKAQDKTDHLFVYESADGHRAQFLLAGEQLAGNDAVAAASGTTSILNQVSGNQQVDVPVSPHLEAALERVVARQIIPLRQQIETYEQKVRLHDILGGIGYIFGLAGLAFFLKGRRGRKEQEDRER